MAPKTRLVSKLVSPSFLDVPIFFSMLLVVNGGCKHTHEHFWA